MPCGGSGRTGLGEAARAGLVCGFIGGIGFAAASMLKLVEVTSGYETNWHSILEQTTGLFNGLALAVAMSPLVRSAPAADDDADRLHRRRTASYALAFVVLGITYLNLRKNAGEWVRVGAMPKEMVGLSAGAWFDLAYLLIAPDLPGPPGPARAACPWRSCRRARWAGASSCMSCCSGGWSSATSSEPWSASRPNGW